MWQSPATQLASLRHPRTDPNHTERLPTTLSSPQLTTTLRQSNGVRPNWPFIFLKSNIRHIPTFQRAPTNLCNLARRPCDESQLLTKFHHNPYLHPRPTRHVRVVLSAKGGDGHLRLVSLCATTPSRLALSHVDPHARAGSQSRDASSPRRPRPPTWPPWLDQSLRPRHHHRHWVGR